MTSFEIVEGDPASPLVLHVPHSSRVIPPEVRPHILLDDAALEAELDAMTDAHTDVIATELASRLSLCPWQFVNRTSRLVVDPERFPNPDQEEMTAVGMGAVYTQTSQRQPLRGEDADHRADLIERYFDPYAAAMSDLVEARRRAVGRVLVVDVHSYPRDTLPYELHATDRRPALCLGVDRQHTPADLVEAFVSTFDDIAVNEPFRGCYLPLRHYGRSTDVFGVMLEVRRDTYLRDAEPDPGAVQDLAMRTARVLDGSGWGATP